MSVGEECRFGFCGVKLQIPSSHLVNALSGAGFECLDNLVYVAPSCHSSDLVHDGLTFDSGDPLLNPF